MESCKIALFLFLGIFCTIQCKDLRKSKTSKGSKIAPCNDEMDRSELISTADQYSKVKQWIPMADCMKKVVLKNVDLVPTEFEMLRESIMNAAIESKKAGIARLKDNILEVKDLLEKHAIPEVYDALQDCYSKGELSDDNAQHFVLLIVTYTKMYRNYLEFIVDSVPNSTETPKKIETLRKAEIISPKVVSMMMSIKWYWEQGKVMSPNFHAFFSQLSDENMREFTFLFEYFEHYRSLY